ncbi:MAG: DUF4956 domain-containing protein [Lachnospiraceae bacterium]|nr:DUF4956 domain-containing protein [Lachnospiraceae bacterium]
MTFSSILSNGFLQGFAGRNIGTKEIMISLIITAVISVYIFFIYRAVTRKSFYSKNFNISLALVSLITCGIILTIQSSLVVSLGMVGALSIVRFRTAVKEPMDLGFMFWSISTGIMCGAGMTEIAIITSLMVTIMIVVLEFIPVGRSSMMLLVNMDENDEAEERLTTALKDHAGYYRLRSRNVTNGCVDIVYEIRTKDETALSKAVAQVPGVQSSTVMRHDGEIAI